MFLEIPGFDGRGESTDHPTVPIDQKLREVPLDIFSGKRLKEGLHLLFEIAEFRILEIVGRILLQIREKRLGFFAVDVDLRERLKLGSEVDLAELRDFLVGPRCLSEKLVAGEVQDLESAIAILVVEFRKPVVLRSKSAAGRRVDDQEHLALVVRHRDVFFLSVFNRKIVYIHG